MSKATLTTNIDTKLRKKTASQKRLADQLDEIVTEMALEVDLISYPSAGIALSTGTAWGTSITDNSANWNTAFGWGNHAGLYWSLASGGTFTGTNNYAMAGFNLNLLNGNILSGPTGATITANTRLDIRGTGTTTNLIQRWADSGNTTRWAMRDDGFFSNSATTPINPFTVVGNVSMTQFTYGGGVIGQFLFTPQASSGGVLFDMNGENTHSATTTLMRLRASKFVPSSGSSSYTGLQISPDYNTTGTYAGTAYGIDYNPTLTSVTGLTHIAWRNTSGSVLIGHTALGAATTRLQVRGIGTTTGNLALFEDNAGNQRAALTDGGVFSVGTLTGRVNLLDVAVNGMAINFPSNNAGFGLVTGGGLFARNSSNQGFTIGSAAVSSSTATLQVTQNAHASAWIPAFKLDAGGHTGVTASELIDINYNLARNVQFTGATGFATQRAYVIQAPTYSFVSPTGTLTTAATLAISGAPVAGTNAAITNPYALLIQSGNVGLGGGATASELRWLEPSAGGTSYIGFKAPALAANTVYDLPNAFPAVSGYVLSSTDAGVMSWVAAGGGGGITNGAAANELMKSDGTNAVSSGIESTTAGNLNLGLSGTTGATRTIQAAGSAADVALTMLAKGTSDITMGSAGTGRAILSAGGGWQLNAWNFVSGTVANNNIFGNSTSSTNANAAGNVVITGGGTSSTVANTSGGVTITAGVGTGTNSSSGNVSIASGAVTGSGTEGSVNIQTRTTGKIGFFNATPVVKQGAVTTPQGIADVLTAYGLLPTSTISGGGGITITEAEIDFGGIHDFDTSLFVADASITTTSKIIASVSATATADHGIDDIVSTELVVFGGNVSAGVGFTIYAKCSDGTYGKYKVNYIVQY